MVCKRVVEENPLEIGEERLRIKNNEENSCQLGYSDKRREDWFTFLGT